MANRWLFRIYNGLVFWPFPFILLFIALQWRQRFLTKDLTDGPNGGDIFRKINWSRIRNRKGPWWWVHAVSFGEVKAIETFLRKAPGHAHARRSF